MDGNSLFSDASEELMIASGEPLCDFLETYAALHRTHPEDFLLQDLPRELHELCTEYAMSGDALPECHALQAFHSARRRLQLLAPGSIAAHAKESALLNTPAIRSGMCPKKRHEVDRLFPILCSVAVLSESHTVINFGEGKGYVSRLLALDAQLQVVGLDCNPAHQQASEQRQSKMVEQLAESTGMLYMPRGRLVSVTTRVDPSTDLFRILPGHSLQVQVGAEFDVRRHREEQSHGEFLRGVQLRLADSSEVRVLGYDNASRSHRVVNVATGKISRIRTDHERVELVTPTASLAPAIDASLSNVMLMGLHACGDLGTSVLRQFVSTQAAAMVLVPCCWQALSAEGFPVSKRMSACLSKFSRASLMLATQPASVYSAFTDRRNADDMKFHFFRAALRLTFAQEQIPQRAQEQALRSEVLRTIARDKARLSFADFADRICVVLEDQLRQRVLLNAAKMWEVHSTRFEEFYAFMALRSSISSLVEHALLLDRVLYLRESLPSESKVALGSIFNPQISARHHAIIAVRR